MMDLLSEPVDIIIPTYNNNIWLFRLLNSIERTVDLKKNKVFVVNNDKDNSIEIKRTSEKAVTGIIVLEPKENLKYVKSLNYALTYSCAPYFVLMNDDMVVPDASNGWCEKLKRHFSDESVAAIAPASTRVWASQDIFTFTEKKVFLSNFVHGVCVMHNKRHFEAVGGIDPEFNDIGGDDMDISMKYYLKGLKQIVDREVFIYHEGGVTFKREYGSFWGSDKHLNDIQEKLFSIYGEKVVRKVFYELGVQEEITA